MVVVIYFATVFSPCTVWLTRIPVPEIQEKKVMFKFKSFAPGHKVVPHEHVYVSIWQIVISLVVSIRLQDVSGNSVIAH